MNESKHNIFGIRRTFFIKRKLGEMKKKMVDIYELSITLKYGGCSVILRSIILVILKKSRIR